MARIYLLNEPPQQLQLIYPGFRAILTDDCNQIHLTRRAIVRVTAFDKQMQSQMGFSPGGHNSVSMFAYDTKKAELGDEVGITFLYANNEEIVRGTHPPYIVQKCRTVPDAVLEEFHRRLDPLTGLIRRYGKQSRIMKRKLTRGEKHEFEDLSVEPIVELERFLQGHLE